MSMAESEIWRMADALTRPTKAMPAPRNFSVEDTKDIKDKMRDGPNAPFNTCPLCGVPIVAVLSTSWSWECLCYFCNSCSMEKNHTQNHACSIQLTSTQDSFFFSPKVPFVGFYPMCRPKHFCETRKWTLPVICVTNCVLMFLMGCHAHADIPHQHEHCIGPRTPHWPSCSDSAFSGLRAVGGTTCSNCQGNPE